MVLKIYAAGGIAVKIRRFAAYFLPTSRQLEICAWLLTTVARRIQKGKTIEAKFITFGMAAI